MDGKKRIAVLLLLSALFASSCAIHSTFPFICFRSGCVHQQWNMRGLKKQLKVRLMLMKRKRNKNNPPDLTKNKNPSAEKMLPADGTGLSHFYTRICFVFYAKSDMLISKATDSLITGMQDGRRITGVDDEEATAFISNLDLRKISTVTVTLWDNDTIHTYRNTHKRRIRYITNYLKARGITRSKIVIVTDNIVKK